MRIINKLLFFYLNLLLISVLGNESCNVSESFKQSLQAQEYLMNRGPILNQPRIGIIYEDNMACPLKDYFTNFMVRLIEVPENKIVGEDDTSDVSTIINIMETIDNLQAMENSVFMIKIGTDNLEALQELEKQLVQQKDSILKTSTVFEKSSLEKLGHLRNDQPGVKFIIFVHSSLQDFKDLKIFFKPTINLRSTINPDNSDLLQASNQNLQLSSIQYADEKCFTEKYNLENSLSFIYAANDTINSTKLNTLFSCNISAIMNSSQITEQLIRQAYIYLVFEEPLAKSSTQCFYVSINNSTEHASGQLVVKSDSECKRTIKNFAFLCRESYNFKLVESYAPVNNNLNEDVCGYGKISSPFNNKEALSIENFIGAESLDGVWINLKYNGSFWTQQDLWHFDYNQSSVLKIELIVGGVLAVFVILCLVLIIRKAIKKRGYENSINDSQRVTKKNANPDLLAPALKASKPENVITQQLNFEEGGNRSLNDFSVHYDEQNSLTEVAESLGSARNNIDFNIEFSQIGRLKPKGGRATSREDLNDSD